MGKATPLTPVDGTQAQFFAPTFRQKLAVDAAIIVIFGALWIFCLAGLA